MKKQFIFLFVAFVAFAICSFDDVETSSDRTKVINVVDYDSQDLQLAMGFSVSNPVNLSNGVTISVDCMNTLSGFISKVEAEELGSPETSYISNTRHYNNAICVNMTNRGLRVGPGLLINRIV